MLYKKLIIFVSETFESKFKAGLHDFQKNLIKRYLKNCFKSSSLTYKTNILSG